MNLFQIWLITIKINKSGIQNICFTDESCFGGNHKFDLPNEIIINNISSTVVLAQYNLEKEENIIQLKWNESRENWDCF